MSTSDSAAQIVARFLRANHYNETLEAFIREAGLPEDAGLMKPGGWTIEQILQEKLQFDTSVNFERSGGNEKRGWTTPAPNIAIEPQVEINSNVLCVSGDLEANCISVTTADKKLKRFSACPPYSEDVNTISYSDSPILSTVFAPGGLVLTTSMSGHLLLREAATFSTIDQCRHHAKYTVQVVSHRKGSDWFVATAGWDQKIHIYELDSSRIHLSQQSLDSNNITSVPGLLGDPIHTILLPANPESLIFARHPDTDEVYLVASRRDSTHLYYYHIQRDASGHVPVRESGRQNLAPHSNAWVAFTPCSLALCPTDPTLLAVATSHLPHMKLIIVRLLFPGSQLDNLQGSAQHLTQASMARAELALQDREDAAISILVSTMAPQTPYSTPHVVWRPDGSGLFVNGDDGVIRGVETKTGKVVSLLKGHEAGSKVRTLWAGLVKLDDGRQEEVLVSGGFDKRLIVWTLTSSTQTS